MKRGLVFIGLFMLLGSMFLVTAAVGDQGIIRLSDNSNAHAEIATRSAYPIVINYEDVFGVPYDSPTDPYAGNAIFTISAATNAHAAPAGYAQSINFGDLQCTIKAGCDIPNDEFCVVTFSSASGNAHLALCENYNTTLDGTAPYSANQLCCKSDAAKGCDQFTTNDTCLNAAKICSWTPKGTTSNPEGGCCPKPAPDQEPETWNPLSQTCTEGAATQCTIPWITVLGDILTGQRKITDSFNDQSGPLGFRSGRYEYCEQVTRETNWGIWKKIDVF